MVPCTERGTYHIHNGRRLIGFFRQIPEVFTNKSSKKTRPIRRLTLLVQGFQVVEKLTLTARGSTLVVRS